MRDGNLRTTFQKHLPDAHWQAVETWGIAPGVPDAEFCFPGGYQGWIEFKVTKLSATTITAQQVAWLERRCRYGGRAFLAVRRKRNGVGARAKLRCDELHLFDGTEAHAILVGGIAGATPLGVWSGGAARWDWDAVRCFLTGSKNGRK
jgi:hypothetical protein